MKEIAILPGAFDRVADRVPKIQKCAFAGGLAFVRGDDRGLDLNIPANQPGQVCPIEPLEHFEHFRVANDRVFDDFRETLSKFARRQCRERSDVGNHQHRLMPGADQVFPGRCVHRRLSANRAVDLRQQSRRELDTRNSAMVDRRDKSREIANHSPAKRDDERRTVETCFAHFLANHPGAFHRFRFLAGRHRDQCRPLPTCLQARHDGIGKMRCDLVI